MNIRTIHRRDFIKLLATLPVIYSVGCDSPTMDSSLLSPDDSLKKLIRLVGPWSEKQQADEFIGRFMASENIVEAYLPELGHSLQILASRFPDDAISISKVKLKEIPKEERDLLIELSAQLYNFTEVRFLASNEPPWGECYPDFLHYTRPPNLTSQTGLKN